LLLSFKKEDSFFFFEKKKQKTFTVWNRQRRGFAQMTRGMLVKKTE
jgi:hypothetical protein